jgi:hypothetical protein
VHDDHAVVLVMAVGVCGCTVQQQEHVAERANATVTDAFAALHCNLNGSVKRQLVRLHRAAAGVLRWCWCDQWSLKHTAGRIPRHAAGDRAGCFLRWSGSTHNASLAVLTLVALGKRLVLPEVKASLSPCWRALRDMALHSSL